MLVVLTKKKYCQTKMPDLILCNSNYIFNRNKLRITLKQVIITNFSTCSH